MEIKRKGEDTRRDRAGPGPPTVRPCTFPRVGDPVLSCRRCTSPLTSAMQMLRCNRCRENEEAAGGIRKPGFLDAEDSLAYLGGKEQRRFRTVQETSQTYRLFSPDKDSFGRKGDPSNGSREIIGSPISDREKHFAISVIVHGEMVITNFMVGETVFFFV